MSIEPVNLSPEPARGAAVRQALEDAAAWRAQQLHDANRQAVIDFLGAEVTPRHRVPRAAESPSKRWSGVLVEGIVWTALVLFTIIMVSVLAMGWYQWTHR
jgi:hypothetical protein